MISPELPPPRYGTEYNVCNPSENCLRHRLPTSLGRAGLQSTPEVDALVNQTPAELWETMYADGNRQDPDKNYSHPKNQAGEHPVEATRCSFEDLCRIASDDLRANLATKQRDPEAQAEPQAGTPENQQYSSGAYQRGLDALRKQTSKDSGIESRFHDPHKPPRSLD